MHDRIVRGELSEHERRNDPIKGNNTDDPSSYEFRRPLGSGRMVHDKAADEKEQGDADIPQADGTSRVLKDHQGRSRDPREMN